MIFLFWWLLLYFNLLWNYDFLLYFSLLCEYDVSLWVWCEERRENWEQVVDTSSLLPVWAQGFTEWTESSLMTGTFTYWAISLDQIHAILQLLKYVCLFRESYLLVRSFLLACFFSFQLACQAYQLHGFPVSPVWRTMKVQSLINFFLN